MLHERETFQLSFTSSYKKKSLVEIAVNILIVKRINMIRHLDFITFYLIDMNGSLL